jgi:hypothetical protein
MVSVLALTAGSIAVGHWQTGRDSIHIKITLTSNRFHSGMSAGGSFSGLEFGKTDLDPSSGSWFYTGQSPEIPTPATIPLIGIALAALGFSRKRKHG